MTKASSVSKIPPGSLPAENGPSARSPNGSKAPQHHAFDDLPEFAADQANDERSGRAKAPITDHAADVRPDALRLIGAVSHEMRNPLNGILGMAHLLSDTDLDASQRSYLEAIRASGDVLLTLVNDLLDLTALQSGHVPLTLSRCNVDQMVNQALELAAPRAHGKGLALGSHIDPAVQEPLDLDAGRVRQVLTNLVSNAIKFTDQGGVRVDVSLDREGPGSSLVIDVRDTGHGIAEKDQALIFQPFGRTKSAHVAGTEGNGLGLPLSRGLAEAMGGTLQLVNSTPFHGSHMQLRVPVAVGAIDEPGKQRFEGQTVLLAMSASPERDALADTLTDFGAHVRFAERTDGLDGPPEGVHHVLVDAAFDHAMLWARLCLPGTGIRPVILLRPDSRAQLNDLRDAGFSGYLIRPVRQTSLVTMLTDRFGTEDDAVFLSDPADLDPDEAAPPEKHKKTVLLAEDSPVNALLARTALERAGHDVTVVDDGARAIATAGAQDLNGAPFDVILLDLSMPVLDGFSSARQIRAAGYSGRIIAISGNTEPELAARLEEAGFDAFVQKPIMPETLQALVADSATA
jgi:signal transduction histidine kinase/CheY-like chemotaxis protein